MAGLRAAPSHDPSPHSIPGPTSQALAADADGLNLGPSGRARYRPYQTTQAREAGDHRGDQRISWTRKKKALGIWRYFGKALLPVNANQRGGESGRVGRVRSIHAACRLSG